jgi:beta-galactosidase
LFCPHCSPFGLERASSCESTSSENGFIQSGLAFSLGDVPDGQAPDIDDSSWRKLNVPHDWSIEGPFDENSPAGTGGGALNGGLGWYRKTFSVPVVAKGKVLLVDFDGVYRNSEVWINGHYLGKRPMVTVPLNTN